MSQQQLDLWGVQYQGELPPPPKKEQERTAAQLSPCGRYRYTLERWWGEGQAVLWIMLNPSTADASEDDPTIRRCRGFSKAWGAAGLVVVNLFAYRATLPNLLGEVDDPIGPDNDQILRQHLGCDDYQIKVAAWGVHGAFLGRDREVLAMGGELHHMGLTRTGQPKHPLYLRKETQPALWGKEKEIAQGLRRSRT